MFTPRSDCSSASRNVTLLTPWSSRSMAIRTVGTQSIPVHIGSPPRVLSFKTSMPSATVQDFVFPEAPQWLAQQPDHVRAVSEPQRVSSPQSRVASNESRRRTRLRVPQDVIKLEDRLYYLLQPPLETLLDRTHLQLPFEPFPYQLDGISFLYTQQYAVLADEMGLGKTMQAITAMRLLLHAGELRSVLLICPKPLVTNWQREFRMWAPEIPVTAINGEQPRRKWQWERMDFPVRIANYELLLKDFELAVAPDRPFDLVVLDEAQRIKNRSSTTSKLVQQLPRSRSWALTGTPIENSSDDLVGIFEFLAPGYLNPGMGPPALREATRDTILRRTKDAVLQDLPPKLFRDADLDLTAQQRATYDRAEDEGVIKLTHLGAAITIQHVFELVLRLKQICNFDPVTGESSKLERLRADLDEVASSGQKAIVFSQWVKTLEKLEASLHPFGTLQYHGRTPPGVRDAVLEQFRSDPRKQVLLMSYGAGSVGLNLQFARYVFLFDRWWNPAVEDQAINRAHRIGVSGPVTVTRFTTFDTIEQRIDQVLQDKRELFARVLSDNAGPRHWGLSHHEIFGLFQLDPSRQRAAA